MQQRPEITKMQARLQAALTNEDVLPLVREDLAHTFGNFGVNTAGAEGITQRIISALVETTDVEATEHEIHEEFNHLTLFRQSINRILELNMRTRAQIVYQQVQEFFNYDDLIVDMGCGDGQVTDYIHSSITTNIIGFDVRSFPAPGIKALTQVFDGTRVPAQDGYFTAGLMTNVAHHESDNSKILRELARIIRIGGKLIVIETVPIEDDPIQFERTFIGDYVWNRLFHNADIPVPGTYETESGWVRRFEEVGFKLTKFKQGKNPTALGYDQPTIRDWHTRLVLERVRQN